MKTLREYIEQTYKTWGMPNTGDAVDFIINEELCIESTVEELVEDGVVLSLDDQAIAILEGLEDKVPTDSTASPLTYGEKNVCDEGAEFGAYYYEQLAKDIFDKDPHLSTDGRAEELINSGYEACARELGAQRAKHIFYYDEDFPSDFVSAYAHLQREHQSVDEAKYQGREVKLGKPMAGDVKKYKVYVKNPKTGKIKKVNFGDKHMEIKRDNPSRRKNFRARHNCADKKDRTKAGYWSCRMWSKKPVSKIMKGK